MKSRIMYLVLGFSLILVGCGNQKSKQSTADIASHVSSSSTSNSTSSSRKNGASSDSSSDNDSSSKQQSIINVDNKTAGDLLLLYANPDWMKEGADSGGLWYGTDSIDGTDTQGYSYITANGDPTSFYWYKVDGDTVTYKYVDASNSIVAEAPTITKTVSLSGLESDYYKNSSQRREVDQYADEIKPQSDYDQMIQNNS